MQVRTHILQYLIFLLKFFQSTTEHCFWRGALSSFSRGIFKCIEYHYQDSRDKEWVGEFVAKKNGWWLHNRPKVKQYNNMSRVHFMFILLLYSPMYVYKCFGIVEGRLFAVVPFYMRRSIHISLVRKNIKLRPAVSGFTVWVKNLLYSLLIQQQILLYWTTSL